MEIDLCCSYVGGTHYAIIDAVMSLPVELDEIEESVNHGFEEVCKIELD